LFAGKRADFYRPNPMQRPFNDGAEQPPAHSGRTQPFPFVFSAALLLAVSAAASTAPTTYVASSEIPPAPMREFRGAWVATVGNIDWPSKKDLTTAEQKAELTRIMDRAVQLNLNAIVFQVRPACDAMYASQLEPWSEYLTGTMGKPPQPFYDPLALAVEEAHKRGLELHAWFNPYRAGHPSSKSLVSSNHISKQHPELVRQYGKYLWLDPGEKAVQDYSLSVVMDVVRRYDIDGVHFDDYFYPYKEKDNAGTEMEFPDDATWRRVARNSKMDRDDWRRENINSFIQRVYSSIKASKPWVKFGISPFGIWRPGNPSQIDGFDAYGKLYADSRKWLSKGWVDYFAPQLYWSIASKEQSYPVLLRWWRQQNSKGRNIYPGLDATKTVGRPNADDGEMSRRRERWAPDEIVNQIRQTRTEPGVTGHILWNMKSVMRGTNLAVSLLRDVYSQPALVPASPWLGANPVPKPSLSVFEQGQGVKISWAAGNGELPAFWVLQTRTNSSWMTQILPGSRLNQTLQNKPQALSIRAVNRTGVLSASSTVVLEPQAATSASSQKGKPKSSSRKISAPKPTD
jgi:uncharacterized lipoprotein YddW (UPF0748 family)